MEPRAISNSITSLVQFQQKVCPEHGPYQAQRLGNWPWTDCPACREIKEQAEAEDLSRRKEEAARSSRERTEYRKRRAAGLWPRFDGKGFDDFDFSVDPGARSNLELARAYAENFPAMRRFGRSLIFAGSYGTGKTHLASAIVERVLAQGFSALIVCVYDLLSRLKSTWSRAATETEQQALAAFTGPDLLVVDEVGVQFGSEAEKTLLFQVFNKRYLDLKPTIVVSNEDAAGIKSFLGQRVFDRLRENGGQMLVFDWASARKAQKTNYEVN